MIIVIIWENNKKRFGVNVLSSKVEYIENYAVDAYLFHQGTYYKSYNLLGSHHIIHNGARGVRFVLWAENVREIQVVGDFNNWNGSDYRMRKIPDSSLWEIFIKDLDEYTTYKYLLITNDNKHIYKADPYAFHAEKRPKTASKTYEIDNYHWNDKIWCKQRSKSNVYEKPVNIYELNLASWKLKEDGINYTYTELVDVLIPYIIDMGYTHIEFMPLIEHPFDGSWGYQGTGYFAATSRFGKPKDLMYLIDKCHQNNIGVIMDWAPCHFCRDEHGLCNFDGGHLFESSNSDKAINEQWGTQNFDFEKKEVHSFLISSAMFWFDYFHIDGLRIDAVAYMIYLNHGKTNKKLKNIHGGQEDFESIAFVKELNKAIFKYYPHALMMAEESTAWPLVTTPIDKGGLGFNFKWNMGWMNDILEYMELDPVYRKYHHSNITFSYTYAFSENFVLPLSHDEVVHGKKSLLDKMPGNYFEKFSNLRLLFLYMMGHPGKKLLFMGGEFAQFIEWDEWKELDWFLLNHDSHKCMNNFVRDLNHIYKRETTLYEVDFSQEGFQWIDHENIDESIIAFRRIDKKKNFTIFVCNFTDARKDHYRIGVPAKGTYEYIINSDDGKYGGSSFVNDKFAVAEKIKYHNNPYSMVIKVPPLGGVILKLVKGEK
jgi:1,4-alpha-glucan branching enzyme